MEQPYKYYIGKNGMRGEQDLRTDKFVFKSNRFHHPIGIGGDLNGPYSSIKELKANSEIYKSLESEDKKKANQIVDPKRINESVKSVRIPKGMSFPMDLFQFYQHALCGSYDEKNNKFSGIHFLDEDAVKIKKWYYINSNWVIKADIFRYNYITGNWILKENTTLFPPSWDETTLLLKLDSAYRFRFPINGKENQFGAVTDCGVKLLFVYNNGKPKTVYPLI